MHILASEFLQNPSLIQLVDSPSTDKEFDRGKPMIILCACNNFSGMSVIIYVIVVNPSLESSPTSVEMPRGVAVLFFRRLSKQRKFRRIMIFSRAAQVCATEPHHEAARVAHRLEG